MTRKRTIVAAVGIGVVLLIWLLVGNGGNRIERPAPVEEVVEAFVVFVDAVRLDHDTPPFEPKEAYRITGHFEGDIASVHEVAVVCETKQDGFSVTVQQAMAEIRQDKTVVRFECQLGKIPPGTELLKTQLKVRVNDDYVASRSFDIK